MLDYHVHLWPHGEPAGPVTLDHLAACCGRAAEAGVTEVAVTEHLFRFTQADALLASFWEDDPAPALRASMAAYWRAHATADLDDYVSAVEAAKAAGLPLLLGLEVDHYAGRMGDVADLLGGYPFDVLLGSVHWLGAWGFDNWEDPAFGAEWGARPPAAVWDAYAGAVEELAASRVCDVLAHPDLPKVAGRAAVPPAEVYDRLADAVARSGMAAEVSSAGWRKPVGEPYPAAPLLERFRARGVPVTTASDAHTVADVGRGVADLAPLLAAAGYVETAAFARRARTAVALPARPVPAPWT